MVRCQALPRRVNCRSRSDAVPSRDSEMRRFRRRRLSVRHWHADIRPCGAASRDKMVVVLLFLCLFYYRCACVSVPLSLAHLLYFVLLLRHPPLESSRGAWRRRVSAVKLTVHAVCARQDRIPREVHREHKGATAIAVIVRRYPQSFRVGAVRCARAEFGVRAAISSDMLEARCSRQHSERSV